MASALENGECFRKWRVLYEMATALGNGDCFRKWQVL